MTVGAERRGHRALRREGNPFHLGSGPRVGVREKSERTVVLEGERGCWFP